MCGSLAMAACSFAAAGCAHLDNDRLSLGSGEHLVNIADIAAPAPMPPASGASLSGMDRSHWEERVFLVPADPVSHRPHYTSLGPAFTDSTPRQQARAPSVRDALDLDADRGAQCAEALAGPFAAALDIILFLPRAVQQPPGSITASPQSTYQRLADGTATITNQSQETEAP